MAIYYRVVALVWRRNEAAIDIHALATQCNARQQELRALPKRCKAKCHLLAPLSVTAFPIKEPKSTADQQQNIDSRPILTSASLWANHRLQHLMRDDTLLRTALQTFPAAS
jgi:hypothetical protein